MPPEALRVPVPGLGSVLLLGHGVQVGEGEAAAVLAAADRRGRQLEGGLGGRGHGLQVAAGAGAGHLGPGHAAVVLQVRSVGNSDVTRNMNLFSVDDTSALFIRKIKVLFTLDAGCLPSLPVVAGVGQGGVGVGVVGVCVVNTDPRGLGQGVDILLQIQR